MIDKTRKEIAVEVFHGIPPKRKRRKMTSEDLAILLSECEKDTPKYTIVSHELNLRIVKEQNRPIYIGIIITLIGFFVVWFLSQWQPFNQSDNSIALDITAQHIQGQTKTDTKAKIDNEVLSPQPHDLVVPPVIPRETVEPPVLIAPIPKEMKISKNTGK